MKDFNLGLFEAWDELDKIEGSAQDASLAILGVEDSLSDEAIEDIIKKNANSLEVFIKAVLNKKYNSFIDSDSTQNTVINLAKKLVKTFYNGRSADVDWAYQLQLVANAYLAETALKNALTNKSDLLQKVYGECPANIPLKNYLSTNNLSAFTAKFSGSDACHTQIYVSPENRDKETTQQPDLILEYNEANGKPIKIEVKCVKKDPRCCKRRFYDADIVLIVSLVGSNVYAHYKISNNRYSDVHDLNYKLEGIQFIKAIVNKATFVPMS